MPVPPKYRRLVEATESFNSFNLFIDFIAFLLFIYVAISAANRILPRPLVDREIFYPSLQTIGVCSFIFIILFLTQVRQEVRRRRELTAFEKEATIKAARKNRRDRRRHPRW